MRLAPGMALFARIFWEKLCPPAKDIRPQDAGYSMHYCWLAYKIGQESIVQIAIVIVDGAPGLSIGINRVATVKEFHAHPLPVHLHLFRFEQSEGPGKSPGIKVRQLFPAEGQPTGLRLSWLNFLHEACSGCA